MIWGSYCDLGVVTDDSYHGILYILKPYILKGSISNLFITIFMNIILGNYRKYVKHRGDLFAHT